MIFHSVDVEADQPSGEIFQIGLWTFDTERDTQRGKIFTWAKQLNWGYPCFKEGLFPFDQAWINLQGVETQEELFLAFWSSVSHSRFVQWGSGDMRAILSQTPKSIKTPRVEAFDIKQIYKVLYRPAKRLPKKHGLKAAYQALFPGRPAEHVFWHRADDDAWAAGEIFLKMFKDLENFRLIEEAMRRD